MIGIWTVVTLCLLSGLDADPAVRSDQIVVVILREATGPPVFNLRREINRQLDHSGATQPVVHLVPGDLNIKGAWTLFPLFPKIVELHPNISWLVILHETTRLNWTALVDLTQRFNPDKEWFVGRELFDKEATIVHHFAFHHDPSSFKYPLLDAGILLSRPTINRVCSKIARQQLPRDFSIDAQHELSVYLMDENVNMTHSPALCVLPAPNCATWIEPFRPCVTDIDPQQQGLFFAVKTCSKFHHDRVPVVQQTWARQAGNELVFFSDSADERIPTVSLGVPNTESGHCSKTMAIIDYLAAAAAAAKRMASTERTPDWYVIADDDTILGVRKLRQYLSCHDPSEPLLIGQRYGYASGHHYGYDYITGGGGMVLSRPAVELIAGSNSCRCPRPETPDDMWLGACAESLGIAIVHFHGFHQARPNDYSLELLQTQFVVSFHKHWMLDPVQVYQQWFADREDPIVSSSQPLDDNDGDCSLLQQCGVKQHETSQLFPSASREGMPDEL